MAVKYFYPITDISSPISVANNVSGNPLVASGNLYTLINEGTAFPNDTNYIYPIPAKINGSPTNQFNYSCGLNLSGLSTSIPSLVILSIRYSGLVLNSVAGAVNVQLNAGVDIVVIFTPKILM